jgi:hypothetical protein
MKFLATFLTTLATGQAVAAFTDSAPARNLKGRQAVAKPETMTQIDQTPGDAELDAVSRRVSHC